MPFEQDFESERVGPLGQRGERDLQQSAGFQSRNQKDGARPAAGRRVDLLRVDDEVLEQNRELGRPYDRRDVRGTPAELGAGRESGVSGAPRRLETANERRRSARGKIRLRGSRGPTFELRQKRPRTPILFD